MRLKIAALLMGPVLPGQTNSPPRPCAATQSAKSDPGRLARVLRQQGTDALVDEVLRPGRELWAQIRSALLKPDALAYFSEAVQDAILPEMSGVLVAQNGAELLLNMSGADGPEVSLRLDSPPAEFVPPGSRVLFVGVPVEFSAAPFRLVIRASRSEIRFLPPSVKQVAAAVLH
jgi:hypothetical protein